MSPSDYSQFLSSAFLGPVVMLLVAPVRGKVRDEYLPLLAFALGVLFSEAIALHLGSDPLLAGFAGMGTALEATALYHLGKNAAESTDPKAPPMFLTFHPIDDGHDGGHGGFPPPTPIPPSPPPADAITPATMTGTATRASVEAILNAPTVPQAN